MPDKSVARTALACLDLTSLNDGDTAADIDTLCAKAIGSHRPDGATAAVCVWPRFVAQARTVLGRTGKGGPRVAAVANFPEGALDVDRALRDSHLIAEAGGHEVDLVLPWRALSDGQRRGAAAVVAAVRKAVPTLTLKLILESGELRDSDLIRQASQVGLDEGVDFLKTSTGKATVSATPEAACVMLEAIARHSRRAEVGFKAAGGIRRVAEAGVYIDLLREILGPEAVGPARLRFGASGLLADIEAMLGADAAHTAANQSPSNY